MKVVVIEDEILIREGLCKLMNRMFPEITISSTAGNGQEGLLCIKRDKPDFIITDIRMPVMDGLEMIAKMQEEGIFPKIIVLTAYSEFSYAQQAVKLGVYDYIIKPVVVQEFVRTIRKIQNLYEQEQKRTPDTMGSLENIISGILYGASVLDEGLESFLDKKYGITLSEIADRLNLTQEYLGAQFHKELGENFSVYIRNYRLAKAKELLIGTQLKQYEIAEKVGYGDAKYFARVFKECVGISPAEYRKLGR